MTLPEGLMMNQNGKFMEIGILRRDFLIKAGIGFFIAALGVTFFKVRRWKYIVVHHSAGDYGTVRFLQNVREQRQGRSPIDCMAYHFVIGNGNGMNMGKVAYDSRWKFGLWGEHVSVKNPDHNLRGIGICLVGNFEKYPVPLLQYSRLVALTKSLMNKYQISSSNVFGHRFINGESTLCPGKHFPMERFKRELIL